MFDSLAEMDRVPGGSTACGEEPAMERHGERLFEESGRDEASRVY